MFPIKKRWNITINMLHFPITLLMYSLLFERVFSVSHIFDENYEYCEDDFGIPDKKKFVFPNKLWSVGTGDFFLYFSLCKSLQPKCQNRTSSCLVGKNNNQVIDLGNEFQLVDENVLEFLNGAKCPYSDGQYSLIVRLDCSDTIRPGPHLTTPQENPCNYEITLMRPDCQPKCTTVLQDAYMIDLRRFPRNIDVNSDSKKYSFSICGFNNKCKSREIGACEISNNTITPLASTDSQLINYDISKNELTARGRYKRDGIVKELNILIKCDWQTSISNARYKKVPKQGRKYRFELESSFGCVKMPQNCFVISTDNLQYNLSKIYNPRGWHVANVPEGDIILNICGPLRNPPSTICSSQYSQVCHKQRNTHVNRGSILLQPLEVADDTILATFVSGSRCKENADLHYNTTIKFRCSKRETGPVFEKFEECASFIKWETPHACPVYFYKGQNCAINDKFGYRILRNLSSETDKFYSLSKQTKLVYNLCGPINAGCNNFNNVSFCLKSQQNQETIIGWDNREIISDNGLLRLELTGSKCLNSAKHGRVTVNLVCNYAEPSPPSQIQVIEDGCIFNVTVFTYLACLSDNKFDKCIHTVGNTSFDLSPLSYRNKNYVVKNDDVDYVLNVCGPIITGPNALCRKNTMVCLYNKTEINMKYQYTPLGDVGKPTFHDNNLIIEAPMGTFCPGDGYYRSVIRFECSQRKFFPVFLSASSCTYNFLWKTPEACPITRNCVVKELKSETSLDLITLEEKTLQVNLPNNTIQYEFHLCNDMYKKYVNGVSNIFPLRRVFYYENHKKYLNLDLGEGSECKTNKINTVELEFRCNRSSEGIFEEKDFKNCILKMTIATKFVCVGENDHFVYSVESPALSTSSVDFELMQSTERFKPNKCVIINENNGFELKLTELKSKEINNGLDKYSFNFDGKLNCSGIVCKNKTPLLPTDACPATSFENENKDARLKYLTALSCGDNDNFRIEILLKCIETDLQIVKNTSCELIAEYKLSKMCEFHGKPVPNKAALIGGIIGGILIVLVICCIIYYVIIKRRFPYVYISCRSDKASVPVYLKNSSL